ncbi:MAG: arylsulfatase [Pirellulaceae bacterium]
MNTDHRTLNAEHRLDTERMRTTAFHLALLCLIPCPSAFLFAADRPNVIVFLSDDQGWGDLSFNGNRNLSTPNIDSLARDGASFDRFFVCPVCSPTRAEFLTGRYHPRSGVYSTSAGGERMNADETTIAQLFQAAGYTTAAFGKWHNGMQYPYHPNARGFDEFYGFCSGHWGNYFSPLLERNNQMIRGDGFVINDFTNQAMRFIESKRDQPFFVYLPYNTPHSPMQVPDRWWDKFADRELDMHNRDPKKENLGHVRAALAMCENIDWNVGRVLQKLDELRIADNTIVVYFCDNGPNGHRWNGDMKGRKGSTDEGGVRSPLFVRWPAKIKPNQQVTQISAAIDLLPTLASMCGVPAKTENPLDGIDVSPLLTGSNADWSDRLIYSHWRNRVSVRNQRFRLDHTGQLYDLSADPGQRKNVAEQRPLVTEKLSTAVSAWKKEVLAGFDDDQRPFVIGHADTDTTQLPARDAKASGMITRSNRFPNCSYFGNWGRTEDEIQWDVKVATAGTYSIELYYTCAADDVGATLELQFLDQKTQLKITKPHDPPEQGAEHDRVKRQESYVKQFQPLPFGTINLAKGSGKLVLRAKDIPGKEAIEFRLLMLRRK